MASTERKSVIIDVVADTVCPWCFVAKRHLDRALLEANDRYEFKLRWHPFQLDPDAPIEGTSKKEFYDNKMGADVSEVFESRMYDIFKSDHNLNYGLQGLTGNTLESHRLIYYAGQQGHDKQHDLVDEICVGYFTAGKYIGNRDYLVECAKKIDVKGAAEFLDDPNNGLKEVEEDLKKYSGVKGIPYFIISGKEGKEGKEEFSGAQPTEVFIAAFESATK